MESVFEFASVAVLGNFLFVAGGYDRLSWCSSPAFYHYDPRKRLWAQLKSMLRPRVSFPLTPSTSCLYAVAGIEHLVMEGRDVENIHETVEIYDPEHNEWDFLPELPFGCFSCAATVYKDNLYISGGISSDPEDNVPTNYLHAFIKPSRNWLALAPMLTARQGHSMISHNDKIFALGGYTDGQDTISFDDCFTNEVYDVELDQWSRIIEIPIEHGHWHNYASVYCDSIYILGGKSSLNHRFIHKISTKEEQISEGEYIADFINKLVVMKVALPQFLLDDEPVAEEEEKAESKDF
jgi:N-acetylneuraminic acid mutarotase